MLQIWLRLEAGRGAEEFASDAHDCSFRQNALSPGTTGCFSSICYIFYYVIFNCIPYEYLSIEASFRFDRIKNNEGLTASLYLFFSNEFSPSTSIYNIKHCN